MSKRLIVLAGLHKTGTSTIQNACARNLAALKQQAIYYPLPSLGRNAPPNEANHSRLIRRMFKGQVVDMYVNDQRLSRKENGLQEQTQSVFRKYIQSIKEGALVIAAENISTLLPGELEKFSEFFESEGFRIDVYCCLRRPKEWLNSLIAQRVAGLLGPGLTLKEAINEYVESESLIKARALTIRQWQPKTHFFSFEQSVADTDGVFGYFVRMIGAEPIAYAASKDNSRHTDLAVRMVSHFMSPFGNRYHSEEAEKMFSFLHQARLLRELPSKSFSLLDSEVQPLKELLAEDNQWLASEFGEGFADSDIEFPQELEAINLSACEEVLQNANIRTEVAREGLRNFLRNWSAGGV